jgi:hypothetical protein
MKFTTEKIIEPSPLAKVVEDEDEDNDISIKTAKISTE